jgi:hypothetical protein
VTAICVGISVWTTFQGFRSLLDSLALWIALAIGLMLFAGDMALQYNRDRGFPIVPVFAFMLLPLAASFSSHFNYFYTHAMRERVAVDQLEAAYQRFDESMQAADLALRSTSTNRSREQLATNVNRSMRALRDQISDPLNPGLGPEAREHVAQIYGLLPNVTPLQLPSDPRDLRQVGQYVENLQRIIDRELATLQNQVPAQHALEDVAKAREDGRQVFDVARSMPFDSFEPRIQAVASLAQLFRDAMPTVNTALEEAGAPTLNGLHPLDEQDVLLGEIAYSFHNGFQERPSPGTTALSAFASIGIDIMPILFALALFRRRREATDLI